MDFFYPEWLMILEALIVLIKLEQEDNEDNEDIPER